MKYFLIIFYLFFFLFIGIRIIFFIIVPIIKKSRLIRVYNPFFIIREKRKYLEIHLGFAHNHLFNNSSSRRKVLYFLTSGLLNLIDEIEAGKIEIEKLIQGNPYFFKSSNFESFDFKSRELRCFEKIRFYLNYFELSLLKSFVNKKIDFVKVDKLRIVYTDARTLLKSKNKILSLYHRIKRENDIILNYNEMNNQLFSKKVV